MGTICVECLKQPNNVPWVQVETRAVFSPQWMFPDGQSGVYRIAWGRHDSFLEASLYWILSFSTSSLGNELLQGRKY